MWTPPQWPVAFRIITAVLAACLLALGWSSLSGDPWVAAISGGIIAGLMLAIAWTLGLLLWPLAPLLVFPAVLALESVWLAVAAALLPATALALVVALTWVVGYHVLYTGSIMRPVAGEMEVFGPSGGCRALIIHHPGRSGRQTELQRALAQVLANEGWRVDLATAHRSSPTDASGYELVVLGAPTYNFRPARPLLDHLGRLWSLDGKSVVLVVTGGGMTDASMSYLSRRVREKSALVGLRAGTLERAVKRGALRRGQPLRDRAPGGRELGAGAPVGRRLGRRWLLRISK